MYDTSDMILDTMELYSISMRADLENITDEELLDTTQEQIDELYEGYYDMRSFKIEAQGFKDTGYRETPLLEEMTPEIAREIMTEVVNLTEWYVAYNRGEL
jgi:hypothetical protein